MIVKADIWSYFGKKDENEGGYYDKGREKKSKTSHCGRKSNKTSGKSGFCFCYCFDGAVSDSWHGIVII